MKAPAPAGNFYCVQRHHATRLHYDFRLEVDGALVSWAVPKGPTLSPAEKRLAMHVEDHPLDYGNFEGNIPKGNYGAGSVMLWDRGTYELLGDLPAKQQLERGDFKFRLHGNKLQGEFAIVLMKGRGKGNEWLLLKKKDDFADPQWDAEQHSRSVLTGRTQEEIARNMPAVPAAHHAKRTYPKGSVKAEPPSSVTPMKGVLGALPRGAGWLYEVKWDGVRAICFLDNGAVRTRRQPSNLVERQVAENLIPETPRENGGSSWKPPPLKRRTRRTPDQGGAPQQSSTATAQLSAPSIKQHARLQRSHTALALSAALRLLQP